MEFEKDYAKLLKRLGTNAKRLRTSRQWTQEETAERGGFNFRYYQKLESGSYSPNLKTVFNLASAFKVNITELFK